MIQQLPSLAGLCMQSAVFTPCTDGDEEEEEEEGGDSNEEGKEDEEDDSISDTTAGVLASRRMDAWSEFL